jgi:hypothetical protein
MKLRLIAVTAVLALAGANFAAGAVTALQVAVTDPGAVVPSHISNDLLIDFTGGLRGQELHLALTQGSIFQAGAGGSDTPPNQDFFALVPNLRYDSFVALGGLTSQTSAPIETYSPGLCVQALGFECGVLWNGSSSIGWKPATGTEIPSGVDFVVARLTFSDDAAGKIQYLGSTALGTEVPYVALGTIHDGVISFVPEPASWILAAFVFAGTWPSARFRSCRI